MDNETETRLWQRLINAETAIEKINKMLNEFQQAYTGLKKLGEVENQIEDFKKRIKTLEEARQRQIQLNQQILDQKQDKPIIKSNRILDLFKR